MSHLGLLFFLKPKNFAKGKIPIATDWDTPPSDLEKATDGDPNTVTEAGSSTTSGADHYGFIDLDLEKDGVYLVGAKVGVWSTAGTIGVHWLSKADGVNWERAYAWAVISVTTTSEKVLNAGSVVVSGRHVRLQFYVNQSATAYAKIYEIWAFKLV